MGLEDVGRPLGSKQTRAVAVGAYLLQETGRLTEDGRDLVDVIVGESIVRAINTCTSSGRFRYEKFERAYPTLHRGLKRDGFTVEDGHLRRALPVALNLPQADDEVHTLLDGYGFATAQGHLDQAIEAHTRGHWAAANSQLRSFVEGLLNEIAEELNGGVSALPSKGNPRRQWLAQLEPTFLYQCVERMDGERDRISGRILSPTASGRFPPWAVRRGRLNFSTPSRTAYFPTALEAATTTRLLPHVLSGRIGGQRDLSAG